MEYVSPENGFIHCGWSDEFDAAAKTLASLGHPLAFDLEPVVSPELVTLANEIAFNFGRSLRP